MIRLPTERDEDENEDEHDDDDRTRRLGGPPRRIALQVPHRRRKLLAQLCFAAQDVVVVLGEAVGFVSDVLQEPQGVRVP